MYTGLGSQLFLKENSSSFHSEMVGIASWLVNNLYGLPYKDLRSWPSYGMDNLKHAWAIVVLTILQCISNLPPSSHFGKDRQSHRQQKHMLEHVRVKLCDKVLNTECIKQPDSFSYFILIYFWTKKRDKWPIVILANRMIYETSETPCNSIWKSD